MKTIEKVEERDEALYQLVLGGERRIEGFKTDVEAQFRTLGGDIGRLSTQVQFMDHQVTRRLDEIDESLIDINTHTWSMDRQVGTLGKHVSAMGKQVGAMGGQLGAMGEQSATLDDRIAAVEQRLDTIDQKLDAVLAALAC